VTVEERTDGTMRIIHNDQQLKYQEINARPVRTEKTAEKLRSIRVWTPSETHPWKSPAKAMVKTRTELQAAS
jgi:hypothetical protein